MRIIIELDGGTTQPQIQQTSPQNNMQSGANEQLSNNTSNAIDAGPPKLGGNEQGVSQMGGEQMSNQMQGISAGAAPLGNTM